MQLIKHASKEKLRGGFYTPKPIAQFVLNWAKSGWTNKNLNILEPSCGDGIFLEEIKKSNIKDYSITAVELDTVEAEKAKAIKVKNLNLINGDFHEYCNSSEDKFDVVVGNPPYIRFQFFNSEQQKEAASIYGRAGIKYSKLSNAWVSFVVGTSLMLKDEGRIGFVVPAELLQVSYAKPLRKFISTHFTKTTIVSFEKLVFPDIQQEVVLLLCEKKKKGKKTINHLEVRDINELEKLSLAALKKNEKEVNINSDKWTYYFLSPEEINFLDTIAAKYNIKPLSHYASVEVGITTGANPFFTVPESVVNAYELEDFTQRMVGRSVQAKGSIFNKKDWDENVIKGARAHLLVFPENGSLKDYEGAKKYISYGESQEIHKGYKCRIRDTWYVVPSLWVSDALMIRRNNRFPRLIVNTAKAYTTDTMHRVKIKKGVNVKALSTSFYNSLSFAFSEISGRSYGGGVLELMPNEAERILLPYKEEHKELTSFLDKSLRKSKPINEILDVMDQKLLKEGFGMNEAEMKMARSIWVKLSERRLGRK